MDNAAIDNLKVKIANYGIEHGALIDRLRILQKAALIGLIEEPDSWHSFFCKGKCPQCNIRLECTVHYDIWGYREDDRDTYYWYKCPKCDYEFVDR